MSLFTTTFYDEAFICLIPLPGPLVLSPTTAHRRLWRESLCTFSEKFFSRWALHLFCWLFAGSPGRGHVMKQFVLQLVFSSRGEGRKKPQLWLWNSPCSESKAFFCIFLPIRNFQGKEWGAFYLADRRILKTQEDAMRMCNLHCSESKERQEIKCQCLCPISWSCLLYCASLLRCLMTFHITMGTPRQEKHSFPVFSLSPPFISLLCLTLWYSSLVSWLSSFTCNISICCVFVVGTISGAMVQAAVSKQRNWLCFVAREYRESISWCCCSRNMGEMYRQCIPSFWGLLQSWCWRAPSEPPVFAGETPRPAELLCNLQTALCSEVPQDL